MLFLTSLQWLRTPLLKGFFTSAGSGSNTLMQACRMALLEHTSSLSRDDLESFCRTLVDILRDSVANERVSIPVMNVISFLLETDVLRRLSETSFKSAPSHCLVLLQATLQLAPC